jgi:hypothetical protein
MLPKFLIPGAGKSGTSSLCSYLSQHPQIFIPSVKEPAFFSTIRGVGHYPKGINTYKRIFDGADSTMTCGEGSTIYMYDPTSPMLIKKHIEKVKLIFVLREPIERTYSNYWQDLKAGHRLPDFSNMIYNIDWNNYDVYKPDMFKIKNRGWAYIYASDYQLHIKRFLEYFPRESMLFLLFEDMKQLDNNLFVKIFTFLGVETNFNPKNLGKTNVSALPRYRLLARLFNSSLRQLPLKYYAPRLYNFLYRIRSKNRIPYNYPPIDKETEKFLGRFFSPRVEELENLIGKDLSQWREKYAKMLTTSSKLENS